MWSGDECFDYKTNKQIIKIDKKHFRPAEVDLLKGDATRAKQILGWQPKHDIESLIKDDALLVLYCK